jgi:uncharacterized protein YfaS (alpha-2-macroglobulin family)
VDRQGVITSESRRVGKGGQVFRFAVTKEMAPNAFVSLSLVRPRTGPPGEKLDLDAPDLRVGLAEIGVRPSAAPLDVHVDVPERAPAGTEVPVDVRVTDAGGAGVAAEVALWAVDEATLRVTGYHAPDPLAGILPRLAPAFAWEDLRRALVSRIPEPLPPEAGGDGDGAPAHPRARDVREPFDPTVLWLPRERTDADGRVHATLHLPARAATYRVMAVAVDAGARAGRAERAAVASMPVVLRPAVPAFATVGDRFEAAVLVHDTEAAAHDVTVTTVVDGVEGGGRHETRVHVEPNGEARVATWIEVTRREDVRLRFEVGGAAVEARVPVRPRGREVRSEVVGAVQGARDVAIVLPEGADDVELSLSVARHPFVGMDAAVDALAASPEAGVEPVAAGLVGLVAWASLDPGKRPSSLSREETAARVAKSVERLEAAQNADGGWGMFEDEVSDPYLTAYAVHALCAAQDRGFAVDEEKLHKAVAAVATRVQGNGYLDAGAVDDLAFALRTLAGAGARDEARIGALFGQRERLSPYGLSQLAMAMETSDLRRDTLVVAAVDRVLATRDDERANPAVLRWYDGSARTIGAVLEAASTTPRAVPSAKATRLASTLLRARYDAGATWSSTHETSHALAALAAYAGAFPAEPIAPEVQVDGAPVAPVQRGTPVAWYRLPAGHTLHVAVEGTAWFALAGRWVRPLGDVDAAPRGETAALHRVLEDAAGKPLGPDAHVRLGDLVRVRLFLYTEPGSPPPPYVAIHDPLAGGLEPIEAAHETSPRDALRALLGMGPDDDTMDARGFHAERSLDDVTVRAFLPREATLYFAQASAGLREYTYGVRASAVGTFVLPPARASALYAGRFEARSAVTTVTVEP